MLVEELSLFADYYRGRAFDAGDCQMASVLVLARRDVELVRDGMLFFVRRIHHRNQERLPVNYVRGYADAMCRQFVSRL